MDTFKNFARSTLASGIAAGALSFSVAAGDGSKFGTGQQWLTIWNLAYGSADLDPSCEIVRVTSRTSDTFTLLLRGQGGTSDVAHNSIGATYVVEQCLTAEDLAELRMVGYVATDQSTASATGQDVAAMTFSIGRQETWAFVFYLGIANSGPGADTKVGISGGSLTAVGATVHGSSGSAIITSSAGTLTAGVCNTPTGFIRIAGTYGNANSTGRTLQLKFASGNGVDTTTVKARQSFFFARKIST